MNKPTLLDKVRNKLADKKGDDLMRIAASTGMSYDTLLRIREARTDPPFSRVQQLAALFSLVRK